MTVGGAGPGSSGGTFTSVGAAELATGGGFGAGGRDATCGGFGAAGGGDADADVDGDADGATFGGSTFSGAGVGAGTGATAGSGVAVTTSGGFGGFGSERANDRMA